MAEGVDRGGLNFPITVDVSSSLASIAALRSSLVGLQSQLQSLHSTAAQPTTIGSGAEVSVQRFAQATRAVTDAITAQGTAVQQSVGELRQVGGEHDRVSSGLVALGANYIKLTAVTLALTAAHRVQTFVARELRTVFVDLAAASIQFGAQQERINTNIAALLNATVNVSNAQGQLLTGAEKFAASQVLATKLMDQLRVGALDTVAPFDKLAQTLAVSVVPAMRAGFRTDQIVPFVVGITNAAATIGESSDRLNREIFAIFSGAESGAARVRIERLLGFEPGQLARMREEGTLADFLLKRLQTFSTTAEATGGNFDRLFAGLQNGFQVLIGTSTGTFFDAAKDFIRTVRDLIVHVGPNGVLQVNPDAVRVIKEISDGLASGARSAAEVVKGFDVLMLLPAAKIIGETIAVTAAALTGIIQGTVAAFTDIATVIDAVFSKITGQQLFGGLTNLKQTIAAITELSIVITAIATAVAGVVLAFGLLATPIELIVIPLGAALVSVKLIADHVLQTNNSFGVMASVLRSGIVIGFERLAALANVIVLGVKTSLAFLQGNVTEALSLAKLLDEALTKVSKPVDILGIATQAAKSKGFADEVIKAFADIKKAITKSLSVDDILDDIRRANTALKKALDADAITAQFEKRSLFDKIFFGEQQGDKGLADALAKTANFVVAIRGIIESGISKTSAFISDLIVDAFDPTKKIDLRERFARFLQDISRLVINELVKIAITKAVLAAVSAVGETAIVGLAEGGDVSGGGSVPGFAKGGEVADSDTVLAWLTPGEWVMKLSAVAKYGQGVMHALNEGLVDPKLLRSAGGTRQGGPGYAGGGAVSDRLASPLPIPVTTHTIVPAIVADDRAFDRLINGGRTAFIRFLEQNGSEVRGALRLGTGSR